MSEEKAGAVVVTLGPFSESKITGSELQTELTTAMVAVQDAIEDPPKELDNPALGSKYAGLQSGLAGYRRLLAAHDVWMLQAPCTVLDTGRMGVTTRLQHVSGEWLESYLEGEIPAVPTSSTGTSRVNALQMVLLATAYLRRGSLHALLGLAAEDMDGSTAGTGADAAGVTRLGTAPQAEAEQAATATATEAEPAAAASADAADVHPDTLVLRDEILSEFERVNADFDAVKAACQQMAGVDTILDLTDEQIRKALDDIRERHPVEEP